MEYKNIDDFFRDFIKQYLPYKNSKEFNKIIDYISSDYLKHLYCDRPDDFKKLYESNTIPSSVYNNILYSLGLHKEIVEKLSIKDKIIFLYSLSDFQRYKGTVKFFKKIAQLFYDKFNIYELYVGQDDVNDWIFKPKLIYKGSDNNDQIKNPFYYVDVYNSIPSLLIQIDQLISMKLSSMASFPLKSNLILLEYDFACYADMIINIIVSSILKDYGHMNVSLYFKDSIFSLSLLDVYFLWFYIITKVNKITWNSKSVTNIPRFSNRNAYSTTELEKILYDYKNIKNGYDVQLFYEKYISKNIGTVHSKQENDQTMSKTLSKIHNELYLYLENRLFDITIRETMIYETNLILNEIYGSLMLLDDDNTDEIFSTYFGSFLDYLPSMTYIPENTTSYMILKNLKPFHVELITKSNNSIKPAEILTPGDNYKFKIEMIRPEFITEMEESFYINVKMNRNDTFGYFDNFIIKTESNGKEFINELIFDSDNNILYTNNNELLLSKVIN